MKTTFPAQGERLCDDAADTQALGEELGQALEAGDLGGTGLRDEDDPRQNHEPQHSCEHDPAAGLASEVEHACKPTSRLRRARR